MSLAEFTLRIDDRRDVMEYMHDVEMSAGLDTDFGLRDAMEVVRGVTVHCTLDTETGQVDLVRATLEFD